MNNKIAAVALNPSVDKTITIEKLVPYGLNRAKASRLDPGGKGVNVARALKAFGADVTVTGLLAGESGRYIENALKLLEINGEFIYIKGETRTNLKILDESAGRVTEINEAGAYIDESTKIEFERRFRELMPRVRIVVLSGSLPPGLPDSYYGDLINIAKEYGVKAVLDADGEALKKGLIAAPYSVKPNLFELETLLGNKCDDDMDVARAAFELIEKGVQLVVVSLGADGAIFVDKNEAYKAIPWDIQAQSTVGAGDSMVAALAGSISGYQPLSDIARLLVTAGTVTSSKAGTELCTLDEVTAALSKVTVTKIELS